MSQAWNDFEIGADIKRLPAIPLELFFRCAPVNVTMSVKSDDVHFVIRPTGERTDSLDHISEFPVPAQVRDRFLRVRTPTEALSFLSSTGPFLNATDHAGPGETLTWSRFQQWQTIVRTFGEGGRFYVFTGEPDADWKISVTRVNSPVEGELDPAFVQAFNVAPTETVEWLQGMTPSLILGGDTYLARAEGREPMLKLILETETVVDTALASLKVAKMTGVKYALCARTGCGALFEEKPTRRKEYCTQKCAHHANVKKQRDNRAKA